MALERLLDYLSDRADLEIYGWTEQAQTGGIEPEVTRFVFEFFNTRGIPSGKLRLDDRLQTDLHLNEALPQEWGDEFQDDFVDRFGVSRLFTPGPAPNTVRDLLIFVQQELDRWRAENKDDHR